VPYSERKKAANHESQKNYCASLYAMQITWALITVNYKLSETVNALFFLSQRKLCPNLITINHYLHIALTEPNTPLQITPCMA